MRLQDKRQLDQLVDGAVALGRNKLNATIYAAGGVAARSSARLVTLLIIAFIGLSAFLFLNLALVFALASLLFDTNLAWGFLVVAGIYVFAGILYLILRRSVEGKIKDKVASQVLSSSQSLNEALDKNSRFRENSTVPPISQQWAGRPAYTSMVELEQEANFKAYNALNNVKYAGAYFVGNYKEVAKQAAFAQVESRVPGKRFITPVLKMMGYEPDYNPAKARASRVNAAPQESKKTDYMPYVRLALDIARPVLIAFTVGKLRGGLGYLLGLTAGRKKRKWF